MFRRASLTSQPVPASSVLHLFDRLRPGQVRGVPWFAPVILKLRDLDEYDDAELVRKKIEACFAAFVTGADDEETLGSAATDADGRRVESFEPGMIEYLAPGKDVKFATPSHAGGYAEYMRVQLHAIAAGVGLTYELLTGDLCQVNYSSIRAGLLEFRRRMEALQWQLLVPGLCRPVWQRFVATAQAIGALPAGTIEAEWTAPRFEAVDPLKDIQADILAVRGGLMTLKEAIARQGYDPAHVLAEIGATNAELDALGIVLDTDPRKATKTGAAKPVEENQSASAIERCEQIGRIGQRRRAQVGHADADEAECPAVRLPGDQRHGGPEDDLGPTRRIGKTMVSGQHLKVGGLELEDDGAAGEPSVRQPAGDAIAERMKRSASCPAWRRLLSKVVSAEMLFAGRSAMTSRSSSPRANRASHRPNLPKRAIEVRLREGAQRRDRGDADRFQLARGRRADAEDLCEPAAARESPSPRRGRSPRSRAACRDRRRAWPGTC